MHRCLHVALEWCAGEYRRLVIVVACRKREKEREMEKKVLFLIVSVVGRLWQWWWWLINKRAMSKYMLDEVTLPIVSAMFSLMSHNYHNYTLTTTKARQKCAFIGKHAVEENTCIGRHRTKRSPPVLYVCDHRTATCQIKLVVGKSSEVNNGSMVSLLGQKIFTY